MHLRMVMGAGGILVLSAKILSESFYGLGFERMKFHIQLFVEG